MSNINFFIDNRIAVFPLPTRSKKPRLTGWPQRKFEDNDASEFSDATNFGVVLGDASGGLVDIDLDCELACRLAPYFLPPTRCIFGRASSRGSHWIYRVNGDAGRRETFDVRGKFAEFRANGHQTVFPPSVHPSGEKIEFQSIGPIGVATRATLLGSLTLMSICGIIEPHYVEGKRHDIVLALSGTLLTHDFSLDEIKRIVEALCDLKTDPEKEARIGGLLSTIDRREKDLSFTQQNHLADLIGAETMELLVPRLGLRKRSEEGFPLHGSKIVLSQDDFNDSGMAKLFTEGVKDRVVFDEAVESFAVYNDGIWTHDHKGLAVQEAFDEVIQRQISKLRGSDEISHEVCTQQSKFLLSYRNRSKGQSAIAQSRALMKVDGGMFDKLDDEIAVRNGIVSLRDGTLRPACPKDYITKRLPVEFDPDADCPRFKKVLADGLGSDEELIAYFQGIVGYWLTGATNRQEIYFLYGEGANGKSTIINAITNVLGPYAGTMLSDTLFDAFGNEQGYDLASLRACRLAVAHEAESKFRLNSAQVKRWTGGDLTKARQVYKDPITFRPQFKIVVLCNKRPSLDAYDDALHRRIKLIPFDYVIPTSKRDKTLEDKLKLEAAGILNFMIEGAKRHFRDEIIEPSAVQNATQEYFFDQDSVGGFLKACTVREAGAKIGKGELFDAYLGYCADEALTTLTKSEFGKVLLKMNFEDTRSRDERQWKGLKLLVDED